MVATAPEGTAERMCWYKCRSLLAGDCQCWAAATRWCVVVSSNVKSPPSLLQILTTSPLGLSKLILEVLPSGCLILKGTEEVSLSFSWTFQSSHIILHFFSFEFPLLVASCAGVDHSPLRFRGYKFRHAHSILLRAAGAFRWAAQVSTEELSWWQERETKQILLPACLALLCSSRYQTTSCWLTARYDTG